MSRLTIDTDDIDYGDGICLDCGNIQDSCEPDARHYTCESCSHNSVYGIGELLIMDAIDWIGDLSNLADKV